MKVKIEKGFMFIQWPRGRSHTVKIDNVRQGKWVMSSLYSGRVLGESKSLSKAIISYKFYVSNGRFLPIH
jgi:hypothetical protein